VVVVNVNEPALLCHDVIDPLIAGYFIHCVSVLSVPAVVVSHSNLFRVLLFRLHSLSGSR
jgi:hypothetical protein